MQLALFLICVLWKRESLDRSFIFGQIINFTPQYNKQEEEGPLIDIVLHTGSEFHQR